MRIVLRSSNVKKNICFGCYRNIDDVKEQYFDGEDFWHNKCREKFLEKLDKAKNYRVSIK